MLKPILRPILKSVLSPIVGNSSSNMHRYFIKLDSSIPSYYLLDADAVLTGDFEIGFYAYVSDLSQGVAFAGRFSSTRDYISASASGTLRIRLANVTADSTLTINERELNFYKVVRLSGVATLYVNDVPFVSVATTAGAAIQAFGAYNNAALTMQGVMINPYIIDYVNSANTQSYLLGEGVANTETSLEGNSSITYVNVPLYDRSLEVLTDPLTLTGKPYKLHGLGDSFCTTVFTGELDKQIPDSTSDTTRDGVGGSNMTNQAERFALTPEYYDKTLLIMDGGLTDSAAQAIAAIDDEVARLSHDRWVYIQPSPQEYIEGSAERIAWDADVDAIIAHVGAGHYVECLTALQAGNDGSAQDLIDVANNITPSSLREDNIHENAAGMAIRVGEVVKFINAKGW